MITTAEYCDAARTAVRVLRNGRESFVPCDNGNTDYLALISDGVIIAAFAPPSPSADDVRREAQRRVVALVGARDLAGCIVKQLNASMRATELTDKRVAGATLTAGELAEAKALRALAAGIKAIRAASNAMEPSPPADYASSHRWPEPST